MTLLSEIALLSCYEFLFNGFIFQIQSGVCRNHRPYFILNLFANLWATISTNTHTIASYMIFLLTSSNTRAGRCRYSILRSKLSLNSCATMTFCGPKNAISFFWAVKIRVRPPFETYWCLLVRVLFFWTPFVLTGFLSSFILSDNLSDWLQKHNMRYDVAKLHCYPIIYHFFWRGKNFYNLFSMKSIFHFNTSQETWDVASNLSKQSFSNH